MGATLERARTELAGRLRERRGEIEETLLTRTYAIADPQEAADPEYAQGLRAAVSAALDFGLAAVEHGEERSPQVPVLLLAQARLAARNNVPLDTVLRRYFAGYTTLGDFIVQEAGAAQLKEPWLKRLLRDQATMFDRFLATITEEHGRERQSGPGSPDERRTERVRRLLNGELVDTIELRYQLDVHHLGIVAVGAGAEQVIRDIASTLDRRLLLIRPAERTVWAWLGGRRPVLGAEIIRRACEQWPPSGFAAFGEPSTGLTGWRLTHRQALAALEVARWSDEPVVRYADVGLLASVLKDEVLADSLRRRYFASLTDASAGETTLRDTLRTYLETGRNVSSAAAALNTSRRTVSNRLRTIEERLGRSLNANTAEIEIALRLLDFEGLRRQGGTAQAESQ
jgi:hypothetical protein